MSTLCGFCVHTPESQVEFDELFCMKPVVTLYWSREQLFKGEVGLMQRVFDTCTSKAIVCLQRIVGYIYPLGIGAYMKYVISNAIHISGTLQKVVACDCYFKAMFLPDFTHMKLWIW